MPWKRIKNYFIKEGLNRTYKERFEMATRLYKIQQTMNKASISHKPFVNHPKTLDYLINN
jgi:hypothetical protein